MQKGTNFGRVSLFMKAGSRCGPSSISYRYRRTFSTFKTEDFGSTSSSSLFHGKQIVLVGVSSVMVSLSTKHRTQNQELHSSHQFINWLVAGISSDLFA